MSNLERYGVKVEIGQLFLEKGIITQKQLDDALSMQKKNGGFLGEILVSLGYASAKDVEKMRDLQSPGHKHLGKLLIELGVITWEQLDKALKIQAEQGGRLGQVLITMGATTEEDIVSALATQLGLPYLQLSNYELEEEVIKIVPAAIAREKDLIPIDKIGNMLTLAMADPMDNQSVENIEKLTGCKVEIFIAKASEIKAAIDKYYPPEKGP